MSRKHIESSLYEALLGESLANATCSIQSQRSIERHVAIDPDSRRRRRFDKPVVALA